MDSIRIKMDKMKDDIEEINNSTDRTLSMKSNAVKKLHEIELHLEDTKRHKQSIEIRLHSRKQHLKDVIDRLQCVEKSDEGHAQAAEDYERRGELHDSRIHDLQQKMNDEKRKYNERLIMLEEAKRKVEVLKRELNIAKKKGNKNENRLKELEEQIKVDDGLLNAIENKNMQNIDKEYEIEMALDELREKIKHSQDRIDVAERQIPSLKHQMDLVKQETCRTREKAAKLQHEMNNVADAMNELEMT